MIRYRPGKGNTLAGALSGREDAMQQQNVVKKEARDNVIGRDLSQITSGVPATLYLVDRLLQANRIHTGLEPYREKASGEGTERRWGLDAEG